MRSKKKWSFDVQCKECGSYLECEIDDVFIESYSGIKMVQCCDCEAPVGIGNITFPKKIEREFSNNRSMRSFKLDSTNPDLYEGVKVLSAEEEAEIIRYHTVRSEQRGN